MTNDEEGAGPVVIRPSGFLRHSSFELRHSPAMFTVSREIDFCYGHRLLNYEGKCRHLHGHNGRVILSFDAAGLDSHGMVVDFNEVKRARRPLDRRKSRPPHDSRSQRHGCGVASDAGRAGLSDGRQPDGREHRQADLRGGGRAGVSGGRGAICGRRPTAARRIAGDRSSRHRAYFTSRFSRESSETIAMRVIMSDVANGR